MSSPSKKRFGRTLSQPTAPTPDDLLFGALATPSQLPPEPTSGVATVAAERWVPFGSYLRAQTYLQLKQAEYWEPGFEIRQFLEAAVQAALAQLPAAQRELPAPALERLRKTSRKLRPDSGS